MEQLGRIMGFLFCLLLLVGYLDCRPCGARWNKCPRPAAKRLKRNTTFRMMSSEDLEKLYRSIENESLKKSAPLHESMEDTDEFVGHLKFEDDKLMAFRNKVNRIWEKRY